MPIMRLHIEAFQRSYSAFAIEKLAKYGSADKLLKIRDVGNL